MDFRILTEADAADVRLPNEPFPLYGQMLPSYVDGKWDYRTRLFDKADVTEECFPDEPYDYAAETAQGGVFVGAYDGGTCIGLAFLQPGFFKYMYLNDLKVCKAYRGQKVGKGLIQACMQAAQCKGYRGLYTIGQDNNIAACLFYLSAGFCIGGLDTHVYKGTNQEGKADILFYKENETA